MNVSFVRVASQKRPTCRTERADEEPGFYFCLLYQYYKPTGLGFCKEVRGSAPTPTLAVGVSSFGNEQRVMYFVRSVNSTCNVGDVFSGGRVPSPPNRLAWYLGDALGYNHQRNSASLGRSGRDRHGSKGWKHGVCTQEGLVLPKRLRTGHGWSFSWTMFWICPSAISDWIYCRVLVPNGLELASYSGPAGTLRCKWPLEQVYHTPANSLVAP